MEAADATPRSDAAKQASDKGIRHASRGIMLALLPVPGTPAIACTGEASRARLARHP